MARMSRRAFLSRSAATALAVSGGVLLSACGKRDAGGAAPGAAGPGSGPAGVALAAGREQHPAGDGQGGGGGAGEEGSAAHPGHGCLLSLPVGRNVQ
jgi:hypothetical protein